MGLGCLEGQPRPIFILKNQSNMASTSGSIISVPWNDGTEDCFYLDFSQVIDKVSDTIEISSDYNTTGYSRQRILRFQASDVTESLSQAAAVITVSQQVDNLITAQFNSTNSVYSEGEIHGKYGKAIVY